MNETHRNGDWLLTASGRRFWPLDPKPEDVCIEDIAHALANTCRFGGHCRAFYSVAQHSVLVATCLTPALALQGLLHDATEAYVGDMVRPFKRSMPAYRETEMRVWIAIALAFNVDVALDPAVKAADDALLMTERRDLMPASDFAWGLEGTVRPLAMEIDPWPAEMARTNFLSLYGELTNQPRREVHR